MTDFNKSELDKAFLLADEFTKIIPDGFPLAIVMTALSLLLIFIAKKRNMTKRKLTAILEKAWYKLEEYENSTKS